MKTDVFVLQKSYYGEWVNKIITLSEKEAKEWKSKGDLYDYEHFTITLPVEVQSDY